MNQQLSKAVKYWHYVAPVIKYPKNKKEYNELVAQLDELLEIVGNDENHKLIGLIEALSHLIDSYEDQHFKTSKVKGVDALKLLMGMHNLSQSDLPEVASQGVLSEILRGKRSLNVRQIKLLAKRFGVDPSTFIDD